MALVSQSELARILGVSHTAVRKATEIGRITVAERDGLGRPKFDSEAAIRQWAENSNQAKKRAHKDGGRKTRDGKPAKKSGRKSALADKLVPPAGSPPSEPPGDDGAPDAGDPDATLTAGEPVNYNKAAALEKHYKAQLARLEYEQKIGQLVPIENVGQEVEREYSRVRARLLAIPSKLAPEVALQDDVNVCRALIEQAITDALNELAADAAANEKHVA